MTKVNPTGTALIYSTFLGAPAEDRADDIALDAGNIYVTGYTYSADFPTMSPLQPTSGGSADAFIAKLSSAVCGNNIAEAGEQCDQGAVNGTIGSCCSATCQLVPSGTTCRAAAGGCDLAETCTGSSGSCPADAKSTAVCRSAVSSCDVAESCDGVHNDCPVNSFQPDSMSCSDGNACTVSDACQAGTCTAGAFLWSGVLQPVNADGSSIFKLGSTIPVKFQLTGACAGLTTLVAKLSVIKIDNGIEGTVLEATSTAAADTGNTFRYDATSAQYIYNLATKPLSQGTWRLRIDFYDGAVIAANGTVVVSLKK